MRTVFLGTSEFAAGVLTRLTQSAHEPALAVTRPDRPQGRGRRLGSPPVADAASTLGVPLSQPQNVNAAEAISEIEAARPDAVVVCAFGALIREPLLSRWPMLNVHPSLLPLWRGAAPIERAIMAGETRTGVSIMRLTEGLDSGPVCLAAAEPIAPQDDYGSLSARLWELGGELLVQTLDQIASGEALTFQEQDEHNATYAEKIGPLDRMLDGSLTAAELERVVRALSPHIGARLSVPSGGVLGVGRARLSAEPPPPPGTLAASDGRLLLGAADGALELLVVTPPGGRAMDAQAYLRGHAL